MGSSSIEFENWAKVTTYYLVGCLSMILSGNRRYSCKSWIHPLSIPSRALVTATTFFLEWSLLSWTHKGLSLSKTSCRLHIAIILWKEEPFTKKILKNKESKNIQLEIIQNIKSKNFNPVIFCTQCLSIYKVIWFLCSRR